MTRRRRDPTRRGEAVTRPSRAQRTRRLRGAEDLPEPLDAVRFRRSRRGAVRRRGADPFAIGASDDDARARDAVLSEFHGACQTIARCILGDRHLADDVAQEATLGLAMSLTSIRTNMHAYAYRCVVNAAIRAAQRSRREVPMSVEYMEPRTAWHPSGDDSLLGETVIEAVGALKVEYREAVQLAAAGYSAQEIAECQDVALHVAQNRILRGRQRAWKLLPAGVRKHYPMFGAGITPRSVVRTRNCRRGKTKREE